jgi:hypothetical protein
MRTFTGPDGIRWGVEVRAPGASNAMVVFHHPDGSRFNRYGWLIWHGPESRSVTARLKPTEVLKSLDDADVARLLRRSMPVHAGAQSGTNVPVGRA